jgi:hypothetical protein
MIKIKNFTFCILVFLCVLLGPQNKQQVFPYTAIIVWYLQHVPRDYSAVHRNLYISQCSIFCKRAVPWLRQTDFDIRLRKPTFVWMSFHQGFVVDKLAMKLRFLLVLRFDSRHGSDEEPPASHSEGLVSNADQSIWVLCCHKDKFLSEFSCLILPVLFRKSP